MDKCNIFFIYIIIYFHFLPLGVWEKNWNVKLRLWVKSNIHERETVGGWQVPVHTLVYNLLSVDKDESV